MYPCNSNSKHSFCVSTYKYRFFHLPLSWILRYSRTGRTPQCSDTPWSIHHYSLDTHQCLWSRREWQKIKMQANCKRAFREWKSDYRWHTLGAEKKQRGATNWCKCLGPSTDYQQRPKSEERHGWHTITTATINAGLVAISTATLEGALGVGTALSTLTIVGVTLIDVCAQRVVDYQIIRYLYQQINGLVQCQISNMAHMIEPIVSRLEWKTILKGPLPTEAI